MRKVPVTIGDIKGLFLYIGGEYTILEVRELLPETEHFTASVIGQHHSLKALSIRYVLPLGPHSLGKGVTKRPKNNWIIQCKHFGIP